MTSTAIKSRDIYRGKRSWSFVLVIILSAAAVLLIGAVGIFYGFQRYIVYGQNGVTLDIPFLRAEDAVSDESPGITAEIVIVEADFTDVEPTAGEGLTPIRAVFVPSDKQSADDIAVLRQTLESVDGNAMVFDVKPESGQLSYSSNVPMTGSYGTSGDMVIIEVLDSLREDGVYLIAQVDVFADELLASRSPSLALKDAQGEIFTDIDGNRWLDPYNKTARDYVLDILDELYGMGFDEVVLAGLSFPDTTTALTYSQEMTTEPDALTSISSFSTRIAEAMDGKLRVSVLVNASELPERVNKTTGRDVEFFFTVFDRVYCTGAVDLDATQDLITSEEAAVRYVPVMAAVPEHESFVVY